MWVFTKFGFFSAVRKGDKIAVRARRREHLEKLCAFLPQKWKIETSTDTDYKYRVRMAPAVWSEVLELIAEDIDYDNFKGAVERGAYLDALHRVWHEMHKIQK